MKEFDVNEGQTLSTKAILAKKKVFCQSLDPVTFHQNCYFRAKLAILKYLRGESNIDYGYG